MKIPRCPTHSKKNPRAYQSKGCAGCAVEARALQAIAQKSLEGPLCLFCGVPVRNWAKHKRWEAR